MVEPVRRSPFLGVCVVAGSLSVALLSSGAAERAAEAAVVERIVAIVGEQPILLSELTQRARPFLLKIQTNVPVQQQQLAKAEMFKELLQKLIDERVVALAADKLNVTVTTKEVDDSIKVKAADLKVSLLDLLGEATKQGLSEADYREEVRREILFGKMLETRARARVLRVTDDDAREYFKKLEVQERRNQPFRCSIITLDLGPGANKELRVKADGIVKAARGGADFAEAREAAQHRRLQGQGRRSRHPSGRREHGQGHRRAGAAPRRRRGLQPLVNAGKLYIVKVTERPASQLPPYADVKDIVLMRVRDEMLQKQIKVWLDELKSGVYIEVRL